MYIAETNVHSILIEACEKTRCLTSDVDGSGSEPKEPHVAYKV